MLLLLDANISPKTAEFMRRRFSFDTTSLIESRKTHLADEEIITLAKRENRIIITQDLDFGELYHEADPSFGVIILRLDDQRSSNVNAVLENFFANNLGQKIFQSDPHTLAVVNEASVRVAGK